MQVTSSRPNRRGNVLVFFTVMLVLVLAVIAFAVDVGYLHVVRTQLQNTADATALASAWDLMSEKKLAGKVDPMELVAQAHATASAYVALNTPSNDSLVVADEDIQVGYLKDQSNPEAVLTFTDPSRFNAVRILLQRTDELNGEVPLFFANVLGIGSASVQAESIAAFLDDFSGFTLPEDSDRTLDVLPFALDLDTWNDLLAGIGKDDWKWNGDRVVKGSDGVLEVNLFPQATNSPGNRGTVDIGPNNNSTADIARQIVHGVNAHDLSYIGGKLELNESGVLTLNGDTGISAGMKDELASVVGKPRTILIFSQVVGPGNNAQYTIVKFAGVRIMDVNLTGKMSGKRVTIQPANVVSTGGIPNTGGDQSSYFIYSPVRLVR